MLGELLGGILLGGGDDVFGLQACSNISAMKPVNNVLKNLFM